MAAQRRPLLVATLPGRSNSFDLIRLGACVLVLVFHSFPLTGTVEPSNKVLDVTIGMVGLMTLFGISGFLVSASWLNAPRPRPYIVKRALRIFPGLIVSLVITAFVIGPIVTTHSLGSYLSSGGPYAYVGKGLLLDTFNPRLPGVFVHNPFPSVVNGSLWTIPVEWCCYMAVIGAALTGALRRPWVLGGILGVLFVAMVAGAHRINPNLPPDRLSHSVLLALAPCGSFLFGVIMFQLRDHLRRYPSALAAALVVLVLPVPAGLHIGLEMIAIPYAAIHLGLSRPGQAAALVRPGDVSYGVYIYSYIIEQTFAGAIPGIGPAAMIAIGLPASWLIGLGSWRLLEHRALGLKARLGGDQGLAKRPGYRGEGPAAVAPGAGRALDEA